MKISLAVPAALLLVGLVAAVPAGAAITFGSAMLDEPTGAPCATITVAQSCTYAIESLPPASQEVGGTLAPSAGVITAWKVKAGPSGGTEERKLRLRVLRGDAGVGTGSIEELPLGKGIYNYVTRLPVQANDRLGLDLLDVQPGEAPPIAKSMTGANTDVWNPPLADGAPLVPSETNNDYELMVQATLEPDADGDGWGDETQDKCPSSTGANAGCPLSVGPLIQTPSVPSPAPVPDTKITKGPQGKSETRKGTFRFSSTVSGSTFQCKLDKKPWKACRSPKVYRSMQEGRHTFKVKAVGPTGVPDPTPAKRSFKVEL